MATYQIQTDQGTFEIETQEQMPGTMDTIKNQVKKSLGPLGMVGDVQNTIQELANRGGEKVATELAQNGLQMAPGTGAKPLSVSPEMAAGAGTLVQMTPDILQSVMPGEAAADSSIAKALTPGAKSSVGAAKTALELNAITAENRAAGIAKPGVQQLANPRTLAKRLGLPADERNLQGIVNHFNTKFSAKSKVPVQDLVDLKSVISQAAKDINWKSQPGAIITQVDKQASQLLNKSVKGRAALAAEYHRIAKVQNILKTLGKYGVGAAGLTGAGYGLKRAIGG